MNAQSEKLVFDGECGPIEALLDRPAPGAAAKGLAVISHPNPIAGGDMHHKVVITLAKAALAHGWTALRYNYRGVGASSGTHSLDTRGEQRDFWAVYTQATQRGLNPSAQGAVLLGGFSYGTHITTSALANASTAEVSHQSAELAQNTRGVLLIGTACGKFDVPQLPAHLVAKALVIHGQDDDIVPLPPVLAWAAPQNVPVLLVPRGGHFFHGQQATLRQWCETFLHGV